MMELYQLFDKDLVFCLHADSQEDLFNQVADLLEDRHIVTSSYKNALIEREKYKYRFCSSLSIILMPVKRISWLN